MPRGEQTTGSIPGVAALFYSLVPGTVSRPTQRRIAGLAHAVLPPEARLAVDVGCGPGWLAIELALLRPRMRVIGVDVSRMMARIARFHARKLPNVDVRHENAVSLSLEDHAADMILSVESMHHWMEPVGILDEIHRVLKPGGCAWIFDGRDDFTADDLKGFTPFGRRSPPAPIRALIRRILSDHGFSRAEWETLVPETIRASRFGDGRVTPVGMYRHIELIKERRP